MRLSLHCSPGPSREVSKCLSQLRLHMERMMNGRREDGEAGKKLLSRSSGGYSSGKMQTNAWMFTRYVSYQFSIVYGLKSEAEGP